MKKGLLIILLTLPALSIIAQTNYALTLNGSNQYVDIGSPLASNTSYTKEAWVFLTNATGNRNIISSNNTPLWINSGTLRAGQAGNYSQVNDVITFPTNQWVHVAVTYDQPTTTMKLYRDGVLVSTNSAVPAYTSEVTYVASHFAGSSVFQGNVDEVRIWNIALTQAQIKQKMFKGPANGASGLVAYYKCNENGGLTLINSCTNTMGLDGTLQNTPGWALSPVQFAANALSFDGINDVVTMPDNNSLDITTAITLEAWVYATKNTGIQNVINKSSNTINNGYIFPRTDDGWTHAIFYLFIAGSWKVLQVNYPSLNAWHHLAGTYDGTTMKVYVDGTLASSLVIAGTIASNSNPLTLGNQTGFLEYFGGFADEFRVWNVARTQAEIQANMSRELDPTTQTALVSYYTTNQGITAGTNTGLATLPDQKGENNGTITNFNLTGANSNFVTQFSSLAVLPVTWRSFTAEKQNTSILLRWSTSSEQNSKNFIVQHSVDAANWSDIGIIMAAGNSTSVSDYSFIDKSPQTGNNYYRIMQSDLDGRKSYSEVRMVRFTDNKLAFSILNNPVTNGILQIKMNQSANLSIYDSEGRLIWQKQLNPGTTPINLNAYSGGIYLLKTANQSERVFVQ